MAPVFRFCKFFLAPTVHNIMRQESNGSGFFGEITTVLCFITNGVTIPITLAAVVPSIKFKTLLTHYRRAEQSKRYQWYFSNRVKVWLEKYHRSTFCKLRAISILPLGTSVHKIHQLDLVYLITDIFTAYDDEYVYECVDHQYYAFVECDTTTRQLRINT